MTKEVVTPAVPLSYDANASRRGDSVFGVIALGLAVLSAIVPLYMAFQLVTGRRRQFAVYKAYLNEDVVVGRHAFSLYANWPWYALDSLAMLLGLIGIYRGRARLGVITLALATLSMAGKLTIVLGSPW